MAANRSLADNYEIVIISLYIIVLSRTGRIYLGTLSTTYTADSETSGQTTTAYQAFLS